MPIRMTGLNSGMDTESIIQEMMKAYKTKSEKTEKQKTKLEWTQDAWKDLNTKVYKFYTNVSNLKYSSAYSTKKASASDSTKATVTASANAVAGNQKLNVISLAQTGYLTGAKLGNDVTKNTTMEELGLGMGGSFTIKNGDGTIKDITVSSADKIGDVVEKLKDAGLNANYDENNKRFYISSKTSGKEGDFEFVANGSTQLLDALGLSSGQGTILDGNSLGKDISGKTVLGNMGYAGADVTLKVTIGGKDQTVSISKSDRMDDIAEKFKALGLDAKFDSEKNKFVIESKAKGEAGEFEISAEGNVDAESVMNILGIDKSTKLNGEGATKLEGTDAVIKLNGVEYTGTTNNFSINGLNITATGITGDRAEDAITIATSVDSQGMYDKIKEFITDYNSILKELNKLYNANTAKGYEPLTDDEKNEMSDKEIEKWEQKIKDAVLRKDSTLGTLMSSMTNSMAKVYDVNGKKMSLSTFGISTLSFFTAADGEKGAYHIDGDSDDSSTSGNTDKLMAAINNDPDAVVDFMKQLTTGLYNAIDKQMKSTSMSSAYTIYNDKQISKQLDSYSKTIAEWEKKITEKEDYYYKKFAAMEKALGSLNESSGFLSGMLS